MMVLTVGLSAASRYRLELVVAVRMVAEALLRIWLVRPRGCLISV